MISTSCVVTKSLWSQDAAEKRSNSPQKDKTFISLIGRSYFSLHDYFLQRVPCLLENNIYINTISTFILVWYTKLWTYFALHYTPFQPCYRRDISISPGSEPVSRGSEPVSRGSETIYCETRSQRWAIFPHSLATYILKPHFIPLTNGLYIFFWDARLQEQYKIRKIQIMSTFLNCH